MLKYYHIAKTLIDNFKCFKIYYIPRENNARADLLSKPASTKKVGHLKTIIQEMFQTPTIHIEEELYGPLLEVWALNLIACFSLIFLASVWEDLLSDSTFLYSIFLS